MPSVFQFQALDQVKKFVSATASMPLDAEGRKESEDDVYFCVFAPIFESVPESESRNGAPIWTHRTNEQVRFDRWNLCSGPLPSAADTYLNNPKLHTPQLDWLMADAMAYMELNATWRSLRPFDWQNKTGWDLFWKAVLFMVKWAMWFAILFFAFIVSQWLGWGWAALTVAYTAQRFFARRRIGKLFASMHDVYQSLDSIPPSWSNTWDLMRRSRDLGAKWQTPLFKLVESRMKA